MSHRVARFLVSLSEDPFLTEEYAREPDLVLVGTDLTEEDKKVLRSGDPAAIRSYVGPKGFTIELTEQSCVVKPPPEPPQVPPNNPGKPGKPGKPPAA